MYEKLYRNCIKSSLDLRATSGESHAREIKSKDVSHAREIESKDREMGTFFAHVNVITGIRMLTARGIIEDIVKQEYAPHCKVSSVTSAARASGSTGVVGVYSTGAKSGGGVSAGAKRAGGKPHWRRKR